MPISDASHVDPAERYASVTNALQRTVETIEATGKETKSSKKMSRAMRKAINAATAISKSIVQIYRQV